MSPIRGRVAYTADDDKLLMKFLAVYNPTKERRMGNAVYKMLEANEDNKWSWSSRHSWQSWRERYKSHEAEFDHKIRLYQKKHNISVERLTSSNHSSLLHESAAKNKRKKRLLDISDSGEVDEDEVRGPSRKKRATDDGEREQMRRKARARVVEETMNSVAANARREESEEPEVPPLPPTNDYNAEIFGDSSTENDEDMEEVVKLVTSKVGEKSSDASHPVQSQEVGPSGSFPAEDLPISSSLENPLSPTLPHATSTPQELGGIKDSYISSSMLPVEAGSHSNPLGSPRMTPVPKAERLQFASTQGPSQSQLDSMATSHKTLSSFTKRFTKLQRNKDLFEPPVSPQSRRTNVCSGDNSESSDEDTAAQARRRRHQPPKIVENAFGRSVISQEKRPSVDHEIAYLRQRFAAPSGRTPAVARTPIRSDRNMNASIDADDRIRTLKRDLAAKAGSDNIRGPARNDEGRHPFSQDIQVQRRTRSFDDPVLLRATKQPAEATRRFALNHRHPFSQSPVPASRPVLARNVELSNGDWLKANTGRHPFSQLNENDQNTTTPTSLPRQRVDNSSKTRLSPSSPRRLGDNHHLFDLEQGARNREITADTALGRATSDSYPIKPVNSGSRSGAVNERHTIVSAEEQSSDRMSKFSSHLALSAGPFKAEASNQPREVSKSATNGESAPGIELQDSTKTRLAVDIAESPQLTSTLAELQTIWLAREQMRSLAKANSYVRPKQEPDSDDALIRLLSDRSKSNSSARFVERPSRTAQRDVESLRTSGEPGPSHAPLEVPKTLQFSSPRLAPSAVVPSRTNSPLDALTISRLTTTVSGSMGATKGGDTRRRTIGGHAAPEEAGRRTPRIDFSARSRRVPRASIKESELSNITAGSSSGGAQSTSSGRGYSSGDRKSRGSIPALIGSNRRSSLLPNVDIPLPSPSQSLDFPISESDHSFIMQHGIQTIIEKLAVNHGFQQSVTWNVYKVMKDLPSTEEVLKRMRESANNTGLNVIRQIGAGGDEDDDDDNPDDDDEDARQDRYTSPRRSHNSSSSGWRRKTTEENTEFSPDKYTRAGEWLRLEMQGRTREALLRERRRATISAVGKLHQRRAIQVS